MTRREVGFLSVPRELVPGAGNLAIVAAINSVSHARSQILGNDSVIFDREIGDALSCVKYPGPGKRVGRADIQTGAATATVLCLLGCIGRKWDIGVDLPEEEPRSGFLVDQHGVLANPT